MPRRAPRTDLLEHGRELEPTLLEALEGALRAAIDAGREALARGDRKEAARMVDLGAEFLRAIALTLGRQR